MFRAYVAEGVRIIGENTAKMGGTYLTAHYPPEKRKKDEAKQPTAEQAVDRMKKRLGRWKK